ncbi:MAG: isoprenylcysteine carboxylmethyltransferase family protein [Alphaproteobacteria bacterium]|nr:isoprenylcysteine carboxylmethyltransferase family protein [Alphaproteobacteria bacterium]
MFSSRKEPDPDTVGVIARPPLIYGLAVALGLALDAARPNTLLAETLPGALRWTLGGLLFATALAGVIAVFLRFRRAGTNIDTKQPTTALVTDGLYRYSRNPVYVALTAATLAIAFMAANLWIVLLLLPTLWVMQYGVVLREEAYLTAKFGDAYRAYCGEVRRWL